MTRSQIIHFFEKYRLLIAAILLLFLTIVILQVNYNKNHMDNFTVDEYFTISTVHPKFDPENTVHRALNGPRVFTYLFYPGALVGMIGHMGANIYAESWDYPGHNYFIENYQTTGAGLAKNMEDPNLRYFHYYLKLQSILLMFLTFIPLIFYLWNKQKFISMFMIATLIGINMLLLEQRSVFYIEPLILSLVNLLLWLYLYIYDSTKISKFIIVLAAFLFALTISLKFSSLFIIVMIGALILTKANGFEARLKLFSLIVLSSIFFFALINWNIFYSKEVFNAVIHDYFSNFWHYATGNKGLVVESYKLYNFKGIIRELLPSLGGLIFIFPVLAYYGFKYLHTSERIRWGVLLTVIIASVWFIIKQRVYFDRNILPFLPALVLITGILLDSVINHLKRAHYLENRRNRAIIYLVLLVTIFLPVLLHANYLKTIFPDAKRNVIKFVTDIPDSSQRSLVTIDFPLKEAQFGYQDVKTLPSFPETDGNNLIGMFQKNINELEASDVIIIKEIGNNKQLTTYLLPTFYNSNKQFASYFVFYNDPGKIKGLEDILAPLKGKNSTLHWKGSRPIRDDLVLREIHTVKNNKSVRLYFRLTATGYQPESLHGCRIYFHAKPKTDDVSSLPEERIKYGFDGWDFTVSPDNMIKYGKDIYIFHDFNPTLSSYEKFSFGIFRGCTVSKDFSVDNIKL
ncbi:hypothetical protein CLV82_0602 [Zeaxanthinibacter enoshimensis]|uniref:Dolichyl-phosphate-mannose-protein mannosyltransferase n=2 Tax=Zeaxanthinibacter enoshimensis TaxID=392009 RepID=A0A4R6TSB4_9FLAO|nr:hypothetical protein CLV82_0602 [Zeaxanthinibacter enoshimensis]